MPLQLVAQKGLWHALQRHWCFNSKVTGRMSLTGHGPKAHLAPSNEFARPPVLGGYHLERFTKQSIFREFFVVPLF